LTSIGYSPSLFILWTLAFSKSCSQNVTWCILYLHIYNRNQQNFIWTNLNGNQSDQMWKKDITAAAYKCENFSSDTCKALEIFTYMLLWFRSFFSFKKMYREAPRSRIINIIIINFMQWQDTQKATAMPVQEERKEWISVCINCWIPCCCC